MAEYRHVVYIIKCKDGTLYTGYTNDLTRRLKMHADGKGAKYTRGRGPFQLMYTEVYSAKERAMQREYQIKQLTRTGKDRLIKEQLKGVTGDGNSKKL